MFPDFEIKQAYSVRDMYETDTPIIPKGYKAIAFRATQQEDVDNNRFRLSTVAGAGALRLVTEDLSYLPFIILEKEPDWKSMTATISAAEIYAYGVKLNPEYEIVGFGLPKQGDIWLGNDGSVINRGDWVDWVKSPRLIIKKKE